jgi:hypothetical protein
LRALSDKPTMPESAKFSSRKKKAVSSQSLCKISGTRQLLFSFHISRKNDIPLDTKQDKRGGRPARRMR